MGSDRDPIVDRDQLVDGIVAGPVGACLLDNLTHDPAVADPTNQRQALPEAHVARRVRSLSWSDLHEHLLQASLDADPWCGDPTPIRRCVEEAPTRRSIAHALVETHGARLTAPVDRDHQEHWMDAPVPYFEDLSEVYECGEFPWHGLRSWQAIPRHLRVEHAAAHDGAQPTSRWALRADHDAPVAEINVPADWADLVRHYPEEPKPLFQWHEPRGGGAPERFLTCTHNAWDLRATARQPTFPQTSEDRPRVAVRLIDGSERLLERIVMPNWTQVGTDFAGVHVTWAGILTSEGTVQTVHETTVTVLRYWFTEQTCWLRDAFTSATLLADANAAPTPSGGDSPTEEVEADRRHLDRRLRIRPTLANSPGLRQEQDP